MELAVAEAKRARDRGDYPIGAVITRVTDGREVVIASAGNRVKTSGSSIKHVELETLKYVSSGYGRYLPDFVLYSTHEPCAMCAGACVWSRIGAVVYGVSQEDIAAFGKKRGTDDFKWRACLISCQYVFEKGNHPAPVIGGFLRRECHRLFTYKPRTPAGDIWRFCPSPPVSRSVPACDRKSGSLILQIVLLPLLEPLRGAEPAPNWIGPGHRMRLLRP